VLWLDCTDGPAWDTLLNRIGAFCGLADVEQLSPEEKGPAVRWALAELDERCLLLWDNTEDIWANQAVRRFIEARPPNCQALLTTRQDPKQPMWPTVEVPPLVDKVMTDLFHRLAVAARVKVGRQADLDCIPHIVAHLQGHPLALMLVVPLAKDRGLTRTWRELQRRPPTGVETAFALSYDRLPALPQRLFARLSVLTIPFEWEVAKALLPNEADVADALDLLVGRAMVTWDGARYGYHALLRQYAYGHLLEKEDPRPVHRLAAEYLQAKLIDPEHVGTPEEGLEEVDQWHQAEEWETFARRASALVSSLDRLGYWAEIRERLEAARTAVREHMEAMPELEADLSNDLAAISYTSGEWEQAIAFGKVAADLYRMIDDDHGLVLAYNNLGTVYAGKGEWDRAIEFFEQALETIERLDDLRVQGLTMGNLGNVYTCKSEWDCAIEYYIKSLEISKRLDDLHSLDQTMGNLGNVYAGKGEWDRAMKFYEKNLEIRERLGDLHGLAITYNNLGTAYANKGEWDRAIEFFEKDLEISQRLRDNYGIAQTYNNLGNVYADRGEWDRATEYYRQSLATKERLGDSYGVAQTMGNLAGYYLDQGNTDQAAHHIAHAYLIFAHLGAVPDAQRAAERLANVLGSVQAANAYLARLAEENGTVSE
jgi:tetratricopeptide (TPR) repeat protein